MTRTELLVLVKAIDALRLAMLAGHDSTIAAEQSSKRMAEAYVQLDSIEARREEAYRAFMESDR